jgi:hypothetical protein
MKILKLIVLSLILISCNESVDNISTDSAYDKTKILTEYADNYIIPNYEKLNQSIDPRLSILDSITFNDIIKTFQSNWQDVVFLSFGPAESNQLLPYLNTYPIDTNVIFLNIEDQGKTDFGTTLNIRAIGFTALDFLVYSDLAKEQYTNEEIYHYVNRIVEFHSERINNTYSKWLDTYRDEFIENDDNSSFSSLSSIINNFVRYYEKNFRDGKLGIPLGIRSLDSNGKPIPQPQRREMPNSNTSWDVFVANWKSLKNFYYNIGKEDAYGLADLLKERNLENNLEYYLEIDNQISVIDGLIDSYTPENFEQSIIEKDQNLFDLYAEIQKLVVFLKVNMASSLGIQITYEDNDGD